MMGFMVIRDNAIWTKHIEDDPELIRRIVTLPAGAPITLLIEDTPVRFRKMRDGTDGRPTHGLRPDDNFKAFWAAMQVRRGETVSIGMNQEVRTIDPYLASLEPLLSEWNSPEDAEAYDGL
jgi:hypothetical protein